MQVAYIDTEGTFRAEKIRAIAARFDLDADAVLDNVRPLAHACLWHTKKKFTASQQHQNRSVIISMSKRVSSHFLQSAQLPE